MLLKLHFPVYGYLRWLRVLSFQLYFVIHLYTDKTMRTPDQVRQLFQQRGESIADWARGRDFSPPLVYRVLRGDASCLRGQTHQIAVALGLKQAPDTDVPLDDLLQSSAPETHSAEGRSSGPRGSDACHKEGAM